VKWKKQIPGHRNKIGAALLLSLLFILAASGGVSAQSRPNVQKVIDNIDRLYRADSSYALMEMEIVNPNWQRTLRLKAWSQGTEKTLIRILEPAKERGTGTLRIGNEMWNYLPKVDKTIRIPPSMMMSSWMGSDFTNDDLVKEFTFAEDYTFRYTEVDNPEENRLYIECTPKEGRPIVWSRVLLTVDAKSLLPVAEQFYDEQGQQMRTMHFREVKTFDNRRIPSVMELVPKDEKGKTIIRYLDAQFDIDIPADTFTTRNLRTFRG
jgi:outer membrane lipoprotein-sorting protein